MSGTASSQQTKRITLRLLAGIGAAFAVVYSVFAAQYFIGTITGTAEWWTVLQAWLVSEEYSFQAGSVHFDQLQTYYNNRWFLLVHTGLGAVCLSIGWAQFVPSWRRNYPAVHRKLGKLYLVATLLSMVAGLLHLGTTPIRDVFSGVSFAFGLWGLDFAVIASAAMAYLAIRKRDIRQHQGWMVLNYSLIFATVGLRFFWIVLGVTTEWSQAEVNQAINLILLPITMITGMVWYSMVHMRSTIKSSRSPARVVAE